MIFHAFQSLVHIFSFSTSHNFKKYHKIALEAFLLKQHHIPYSMSYSLSPPPVGTQAERDLDSRLDAAITTSSTLIEEALKQLAMPCIITGEDEETADDEYDILTPIDLAISRSNALLEEARNQLASPTGSSFELTEAEIEENRAAQAWLRTYKQIEQTNDVRSDASSDLARSILNDIEDADKSGALLDQPYRPSVAARPMCDFVQSSTCFREEKRAKRLSRTCGGPKVAAVVAKIEAIDESTNLSMPVKIMSRMVLVDDGLC